MKEKFNNQFATQKLLREAEGPFYVVSNKGYGQGKSIANNYKPFPSLEAAQEFADKMNDLGSGTFSKFQTNYYVVGSDHEDFEWVSQAAHDKHNEPSDYMKHRQDPEYYEKEFQKTGTSDYFQRRGMDETSATGAGANFVPGTGEQLATPKAFKKTQEQKDVEPKLAAGPADIYMKKKWGWKEAPSIPNRSSEMFDYKELWPGKELNENYSRFKKETKTRTNEQQLHAAMRLAEKKIHEANRILEYTAQLRGELNETKVNKNTQKLMEKITRGIAEAYGKMKKLK